MKQATWLSLVTMTAVLTACNGNSKNETAVDSTVTTSTATTATTATNTANYAAMADTFRVNSEAGNYLDAKTGKPIRIKYDVATRRAVNEESSQPVWRYVDRRNWWVYGANNDNWQQVGEARMQGSSLQYKSSSDDNWIDYDARWRDEDMRMMHDSSSGNMSSGSTSTSSEGSEMDANGKVKVKDNGNKVKDDDVKVKISKDGDIKIKDRKTGEKVKYDAQTGKVKSGN